MHSQTQIFFGLKDPAFTQPPATPYLDDKRKRVAEQLQNLVARRGFALLTAASGCGKTTVLHYLSATLNDNHHQWIYIPFSFLEHTSMLKFIASTMGLQEKQGVASTIRQLQKHLDDIQPVNPVIVIDEAERLEIETMRMIRAVANNRPNTTHHCTLILAGADSFVQHKLRLKINEPLRQRITLYARLDPLDPTQIQHYIEHHLAQAGAQNSLFQPAAVQLIHELTSGIPRLINTIAEAAMDLAAETQHSQINLEHIHKVANWTLLQQQGDAQL